MNLEKRKSRTLAVMVPRESGLAARAINDVGRLMALQWMCSKQPGDSINADLKSIDYFISEEVRECMAA